MTLQLEIVVPDGVVVHVPVISVQAADASGSFGLLAHHEPFLTVLSPGVLTYREPGGRERFVALDGGVLLMENSCISVATRDAIVADRVEDIASATAAMLTRREAEEREARVAFGELEAALRRALSRVEQRT